MRAVASPGSVFDPESKSRFERAAFLRVLSNLITIPVMPDNESSDYLATQAIADFLATENNPLLDGIIYSSVQHVSDSLNIVLFQKAGRVEAIDIPEGSDIDVHLFQETDDGAEPDFKVFENVPPSDESTKPQNYPADAELHDWENEPQSLHSDERPATLRIDLESIEVHEVGGVEFATKKHRVSRHRMEKLKPGSEPF